MLNVVEWTFELSFDLIWFFFSYCYFCYSRSQYNKIVVLVSVVHDQRQQQQHSTLTYFSCVTALISHKSVAQREGYHGKYIIMRCMQGNTTASSPFWGLLDAPVWPEKTIHLASRAPGSRNKIAHTHSVHAARFPFFQNKCGWKTPANAETPCPRPVKQGHAQLAAPYSTHTCATKTRSPSR